MGILQVIKINKEMLKMISGIQQDDNMQICNEIHVQVLSFCFRCQPYTWHSEFVHMCVTTRGREYSCACVRRHVVECIRAHVYNVFTLEPRLSPVTKKYTEDILAHHRES